MAWYLSEVVTDLSPIRKILRLYDQLESFPEGDVHDEYKKRLVPLLRQVEINTDHIDSGSIPTEYENDEYKWLASEYHSLIYNFGLVKFEADEQSDHHSLELTDTGRQILNQDITIPELLKDKLQLWRNDAGIHPYPMILDLISDLKQRNLYPCGGLLLLEVLIALQQLNRQFGDIRLFDRIYERRKEFYSHMSGEPRIDLVDYSGYLWEQMSQDLSNYHAANYPTRSTLQLMMYAGDLIYGPVPDEIFGLVQYVTLP